MPTNREKTALLDSSRQFDFLGFSLHNLTGAEIASSAAAAVTSRTRTLILNVNAHMVMLARRHGWLLDELNAADITFCDGAGVQFGIWLLTGHLPNRTTPPEWIDDFARRLPRGSSIFWVGGAPGVVERAAEMFANRHKIATAGLQHGFFDHRRGSADNQELIARINRASPDVVLVNLGMPLQERWLADHWDQIDARVAIAGGALVDHIAGVVRRPPMWVSNLGLEWVVRLSREPKRLWRRYLLGLPPFAMAILREKMRMMLARAGAPRTSATEAR